MGNIKLAVSKAVAIAAGYGFFLICIIRYYFNLPINITWEDWFFITMGANIGYTFLSGSITFFKQGSIIAKLIALIHSFLGISSLTVCAYLIIIRSTV